MLSFVIFTLQTFVLSLTPLFIYLAFSYLIPGCLCDFNMLTRRAASLEEKLRATLKELDSSQSTVRSLLKEREESEVEIGLVVKKNSELKNQLAELHVQHVDILEQHHQLRQLVANFKECSDTYDQALKRISELELELSKAHNTITHLEFLKSSEESANTCSLYDELVGSLPGPVCVEPIVTIDLTNDTLTKHNSLTSHNKIKKYIKINKLIRKIKKSLKGQKLNKFNLVLRQKNLNLVHELKQCNIDLELCRTQYDTDTQSLRDELFVREFALRDIFSKYEASQQDLSKRMQEANELVDLVRYNAERYESLTNNLSCSCACPQAPDPQHVTQTPQATHPEGNTNTTYVFSDKFGLGFGSVFNQCSEKYIINNCLPGASFSQVINSIKSTKINPNATVILLFGDSLAVKRKDILDCINLMFNLNESINCKFVFSAFPYSHYLSDEQNKHIYKLNLLLYNRTCHSDAIFYIDFNSVIADYKLTRDSMYLPANCRRQIANILACHIHSDTGTCYVPRSTVSSNTNICIDTPSSLNY